MRAILLCLPLLLAAPLARAQAPEPGQLCRAAIAQAERERGLPPRLLAAIGRVESGRRDPQTGALHPWPWAINAEGRGSFFPDKAAAIAAVRALQAQGVRSIDVGCLQVNLRHHPNAFASLEEAFDPLANARYAARFLGELQAARGDWLQAAAHYHSQTPGFAEPYRARVAAAWLAEQGLPAPAAAPAMLATAPVPGGGGGMLDNGAGRAAVLPAAGGGGRGLEAYRAAPIPLAGRAVMLPPRRS
ncbi:lytic transglycosylase domain-containing protein [Paracraurococcus lichenis]|uniref:Lytic transglycosylase domain-containing protein n=1 Tax=Paracraurococcus lichenis TaxID=3064888 RepID=A0ABT9E5C7_9PROT|nr:lytic transglycosylase domain-containing protein [Paracraurococcus sp. LOR1-02]MDO9711369.1 lytic transglycosylase domain-containing protein [Paracraurococcus sp. LOR1-02]